MANATGANIKGDAPLLHPLSKWRWNQVQGFILIANDFKGQLVEKVMKQMIQTKISKLLDTAIHIICHLKMLPNYYVIKRFY